MKKIKYIFGIGLLGALFSTCFGYTGVNSIFSVITSTGQTYGYMVGYDSGFYKVGLSPWYWFDTSHIPTFNTSVSWESSTLSGRHLSNITENFLTPFGFNITGTNHNGDFSFISSVSSNPIFYSFNVDYTLKDSFPFIIDSTNGSYLTFKDSSTIIYNGQSFPIQNSGIVQYCFYGIDLNLSCLVSSPNSEFGFKFISFGLDDGLSFHQYNNYAIIPLHESFATDYRDIIFSGSITLVLSYGYYGNAQNQGIIWNLYNCYSSNPEVLKTCNLNSKGYVDINSNVLFNRSFLSFIGNSNNLTNYMYGSFSEIFYTGGKFIFRSNSSLNNFSSTSTSSTNQKNNCFYTASCFGSGVLPLQNDSTVVNILEVSEGGDFSYTGTVSMNFDCYNAEFCEYYTGANGNMIKSCHTQCVSSGVLEEGSYIGYDGTVYYMSGSVDINGLFNGSYVFDPSFFGEDGLLSVDYYSGLFNGDSSFKFGVCPYPASDLLGFATRIKIGNFYPFMPLNCFVSAFQQGAKVHFFDDFGLFPDLNSQLISGDTHFHITLFRFFDFLLSIGLLFILSALHRLLVK